MVTNHTVTRSKARCITITCFLLGKALYCIVMITQSYLSANCHKSIVCQVRISDSTANKIPRTSWYNSRTVVYLASPEPQSQKHRCILKTQSTNCKSCCEFRSRIFRNNGSGSIFGTLRLFTLRSFVLNKSFENNSVM